MLWFAAAGVPAARGGAAREGGGQAGAEDAACGVGEAPRAAMGWVKFGSSGGVKAWSAALARGDSDSSGDSALGDLA